MLRTQCVVTLVVLYVGLAQCWDIVVTKGNDELEFYENGTMTESYIFDNQNLTALVHDEVHDRLLFVDKQSDGDYVCSYEISNNVVEYLTEQNGRNIYGLAYDPATELLFFSDTNERSINWISLKRGSNNTMYGNLLIQTGDAIPTDIAVDSCNGYVYWINTNVTIPTIERAAFNGSGREQVVTSPECQPYNLVIDQLTKKLYFVLPENSSLYYIGYTDLDGANAFALATMTGYNNTDLGQPSTNILTVSKTSLYWKTWCPTSNCEDMSQLVWKLPKIDPSEHHIDFEVGVSSPTGGIVANYKTKENYQHIPDCEPLNNLFQNN